MLAWTGSLWKGAAAYIVRVMRCPVSSWFCDLAPNAWDGSSLTKRVPNVRRAQDHAGTNQPLQPTPNIQQRTMQAKAAQEHASVIYAPWRSKMLREFSKFRKVMQRVLPWGLAGLSLWRRLKKNQEFQGSCDKAAPWRAICWMVKDACDRQWSICGLENWHGIGPWTPLRASVFVEDFQRKHWHVFQVSRDFVQIAKWSEDKLSGSQTFCNVVGFVANWKLCFLSSFFWWQGLTLCVKPWIPGVKVLVNLAAILMSNFGFIPGLCPFCCQFKNWSPLGSEQPSTGGNGPLRTACEKVVTPRRFAPVATLNFAGFHQRCCS